MEYLFSYDYKQILGNSNQIGYRFPIFQIVETMAQSDQSPKPPCYTEVGIEPYWDIIIALFIQVRIVLIC